MNQEISKRAAAFTEARSRLTDQRASVELTGEIKSLQDSLKVENEPEYEKAKEYIEQLLPTLFSQDVLQKPEVVAAIKTMEKVFFGLGEELAPFYAGMTDWIHTTIQDVEERYPDADPLLVFEGRDSLAFLATYAKTHPNGHKWLYSRGNRRSLNSFYAYKDGETGEIVEAGEEEQKLRVSQKAEVLDWYEKKQLGGKDLFFVDFGFAGTLPRVQKLLVEGSNIEPPNSQNILLAITFKNLGESVFRKGENSSIDIAAFPEESREEINQTDTEMNDNHVIGYMNTQFADRSDNFDFIQGGVADSTFLKVFQELGSYIRESRSNAFTPIQSQNTEGGNFVIDSAFGVIAKYMFMKGLLGADFSQVDTQPANIIRVLNKYYAKYKQHPHLYGIVGDLDEQTDNENINSIYDDMNHQLMQAGYPKVPKF